MDPFPPVPSSGSVLLQPQQVQQQVQQAQQHPWYVAAQETPQQPQPQPQQQQQQPQQSTSSQHQLMAMALAVASTQQQQPVAKPAATSSVSFDPSSAQAMANIMVRGGRGRS